MAFPSNPRDGQGYFEDAATWGGNGSRWIWSEAQAQWVHLGDWWYDFDSPPDGSFPMDETGLEAGYRHIDYDGFVWALDKNVATNPDDSFWKVVRAPSGLTKSDVGVIGSRYPLQGVPYVNDETGEVFYNDEGIWYLHAPDSFPASPSEGDTYDDPDWPLEWTYTGGVWVPELVRQVYAVPPGALPLDILVTVPGNESIIDLQFPIGVGLGENAHVLVCPTWTTSVRYWPKDDTVIRITFGTAPTYASECSVRVTRATEEIDLTAQEWLTH